MTQFNQNNQSANPLNAQSKQPTQGQTAIKPPVDKQTMVSCHEQAAKHHEQAAKLHSEAAQYHQSGHYEKGYAAAHVAAGHTISATEASRKACTHSAGNTCSSDQPKG